MTLSVRQLKDSETTSAVAAAEIDLSLSDGGGYAYVRLLLHHLVTGAAPEVGLTVRGTLGDPDVSAWLAPEQAMDVAGVLGVIAGWPADALAALAAALRQSAAAAEGVRS